jgi:aconitate hydratase
VLSGNRNFEGRVNPQVRSNYLASPPLVVAYALAGRIDIDLTTEPIADGIYLKDIWPTPQEIIEVLSKHVTRDMFASQYAGVFAGDAHWNAIRFPEGDIFQWDDKSTYIKRPPYFDNMVDPRTSVKDIPGLRALAVLGDSVTTDHISPAGNIALDSPAGNYLIGLGVKPADFNSYGARRGNHEVMMRGTLANIRLKNLMVPGVEGGWSIHPSSPEKMFIYDVAMKYQSEGIGTVIVAGKEYGSGSSRDWAAKGVMLLGVKAVIAESFERIHRSNLVGMGVLPTEFLPGQNRETLGLDGSETFDFTGVVDGIVSKRAKVAATRTDGSKIEFEVKVRVDTPREAEYYRHGGILPYVLRQLAS